MQTGSFIRWNVLDVNGLSDCEQLLLILVVKVIMAEKGQDCVVPPVQVFEMGFSRSFELRVFNSE